MSNHLKNNNQDICSSPKEEQNSCIISNEEKELLDLLSDMLVEDIINVVKSKENDK